MGQVNKDIKAFWVQGVDYTTLKINAKTIDTKKRYKKRSQRLSEIRKWEEEHDKPFESQQIGEAYVKKRDAMLKKAKQMRLERLPRRLRKRQKNGIKSTKETEEQKILARVEIEGGKLGALNFTLWWQGVDDLDLSAYFVGGKCRKPECQSVTTSDNGEKCNDCGSDWITQYNENEKIAYHNNKMTYKGSDGELDLDANGGDHCVLKPLENIVFKENAPDGEYIVAVKLYRYKERVNNVGKERSASDVIPFKLLVSTCKGTKIIQHDATKGIQNAGTVATFKVTYKQGEIKFFEPTNDCARFA